MEDFGLGVRAMPSPLEFCRGRKEGQKAVCSLPSWIEKNGERLERRKDFERQKEEGAILCLALDRIEDAPRWLSRWLMEGSQKWVCYQ